MRELVPKRKSTRLRSVGTRAATLRSYYLKVEKESPSSQFSIVKRQLFENVQRYDPREVIFDHGCVKDLKEWYEVVIKQKKGRALKLEVALECKEEGDALWFSLIWRRRQWLGDDHIDVLINYAIVKFNEDKALWRDD